MSARAHEPIDDTLDAAMTALRATFDLEALAREQRPDGTLLAQWPAGAVLLESPTLAGNDATLAGAADDDDDEEEGAAAELAALLETLPRVAIAGSCEGLPELELGPVLGEGGMGIVREARQLSLARPVAVKTAHSSLRSLDSRSSTSLRALTGLLHEARITGALEHPAIVPVYALGRNDEGLPVFVMKRVEGVPWSELLEHPERDPGAASGVEPLVRHLQLLMRVCEAVHFAHSRGIVHRDIKPNNVMVGAFGEVYLLDWGIALRLEDGAGPVGLVGTPGYMAREMVDSAGRHGPIAPHTDVYLLGATLYEVLTGRPPHAAPTLVGTLGRALLGRIEALPASIPEDLAAICRRALAAEPAERFPDVEAFRRALGEHLERRAALRLGAQALERLAQLEAQVTAAVEQRPHDAIQIYAVLGETRFGLEQALQASPDHRAAAAGLHAMRRAMVRYELVTGRLEAARAWLDGLPDDDEAHDAVEAASRDHARASQEIARLREVAADTDLDHGRRARFGAALRMALAWLALGIAAGWSARTGHFVAEHGTYAAGLIAFLVLTAGFTWRNRAELLGNAANRAITLTMYVIQSGLAVFWLVAGALGVPFAQTMSLILLVLTIFAATLACFVDRRLLVGAGAFGSAALATVLWPAHGYEILGVANLVALGHTAWVWAPDCNGEYPVTTSP